MAKSVVDGVLFSDIDLPGTVIQQVTVSISRQNTLPSDLKKKMAEQVKSLGGNAVSNFEVAQSASHWTFKASIFMWDSETLCGVGNAVKIPKDKMSEALGK